MKKLLELQGSLLEEKKDEKRKRKVSTVMREFIEQQIEFSPKKTTNQGTKSKIQDVDESPNLPLTKEA